MNIMALRIKFLLCLAAYMQLTSAFMKVNDFLTSDLLRCYDTNAQDARRISLQNIHGQALPLPNSIETFISLIEKYELQNPTAQPRDTALKLLQSFRIDDLDPDLEDRILRDSTNSLMYNKIKLTISNVPQSGYNYGFKDDDFTDDEKCALHVMLSHTINDTRSGDAEALENKENIAKKPYEVGVVSLHSKWNHAFALGRVLLGILAGYMPNKEVKANTIIQAMNSDGVQYDATVNPVYAITMADLVTRLARALKNNNNEIKILPNGIWDDIVCPTSYQLEDNNEAFVSMSELRGGIDGLIIGKKIQDNKESYVDIKLSQILRMYYGFNGLLDNERTRWCNRERAILSFTELEGEMVKFNNILKVIDGGAPDDRANANEPIARILTEIKNKAFKDMDAPECSFSDMSADRKYVSPNNIFVILDYNNAGKLQFQREVIGNLSTNFDVRPLGNLMGVYTNSKPNQQNVLDTVVKNNGTAGCAACFAKYYYRQSNREEESEVLRDFNYTLTSFEEEKDEYDRKYQLSRAGSPGKVALYFNFGSPSNDYSIQEALWVIKKYFGGVTFLAVGDNKETLKIFTENEDTDIFTGSNSAEKTAKDIKDRLKQVPAEFQFKDCYQSTKSREAENRQEAFIPPNKIQYWAMYPQYFLKSYGFSLIFKAQEGSSITVCFTRWFPNILNNDRNLDCKTSNGEEIAFERSNPCNKRTVYNCDPFFFSVEAKKPPIEVCKSLRCSTPKDIQFEFRHEGISCSLASLATISNLALLLAAVMLYLHRH